MKKCDLFPLLDNQEKRLNQLQCLSNLLVNAGSLPDHSKSDLCACLSIVSDLSNAVQQEHKSISESVIQLSIVNDCVNGVAG